MNAFQPSKPPQQPATPRRRSSGKIRPQRPSAYRGVMVESTAKLVVNVVLSAAAIAALIQLLPFQVSRQAKLQEIQAEVQRTEKRVDDLNSQFSRHFDPQQTQKVMQEQSPRVAPNERPVILLNNDTPHEEPSPHP